MNFSRFNPKNDPKQNAGQASAPSTPDQHKAPAQGDQKGDEAKPTAQAPGTPDISKHDGQDGKAGVKASSDDKASAESMVSEGGHATPGKTPGAVLEPDAATPAKTEPMTGSADGKTDGLSAKSAS